MRSGGRAYIRIAARRPEPDTRRPMRLTVTTWNINSVRLRINLVAKFLKAVRPDVLCLQETKCPDDKFPFKRFKRLGYEHIALNGQKGYHGVAVISRVPFESFKVQVFCGKSDCRHISAVVGERAGLRDPITVHNLYVPAGGDLPDPELNPKFAHKLSFLDEMREAAVLRPETAERAIQYSLARAAFPHRRHGVLDCPLARAMTIAE